MISVLLQVHVVCALISIVLFVWRGLAVWVRRPVKHRFLRRTLPDCIDTLFLASGVMMAFLVGVSPLENSWLAAKIVGLLLFILLGVVTLRATNIWLSRSGFIAAVCVFLYILAVAHARDPQPWM